MVDEPEEAGQSNQIVQLRRIIESDDDLVGLLSFAYLLAANSKSNGQDIFLDMTHLPSEVINIYRKAAFAALEEYASKRVKEYEDREKLNIASKTYNELIRDNLSFLSAEQRSNYAELREEVIKASSTWKQIVISIIGSFLFGVVISLAAYVANPFSDVVKAIEIAKSTERALGNGKDGPTPGR